MKWGNEERGDGPKEETKTRSLMKPMTMTTVNLQDRCEKGDGG